ncbi:hypothetical protein [Vibrio sp. B1FLJ16]|uniref:hypothetical protein n=1 Tax=Vibrio sp. B1FLJ16 TaxID=2751178 RepID=UPI0015F3896B|nr:hypothetical protein [Vibrio sp. B1FLJ16]CAD7806053.1 hypothetical protein ACOMICROBIO_EPCKBFOG_01471 [Vibrio sp. B1FLJ16]CAE6902281.1 hypothetical protein ACOMICROBIO_EPCKBFOG_01471 [Vibrio sp. B1FLJ16]
MNTQLIAGQSIPLTPDGNWLYLKSAQAEIDVYRQDTGERVTLAKSSVFNVGEGKSLGRLIISSRTDNAIELQAGYGSFTPPVEGQSVVVQALPPVEIGENQQIAVNQLPAVEIAPDQHVAVSQLPDVNVASMPEVTIEGFKTAIRISAAQIVRVAEEGSDNLVTEAVSSFPHNIPANELRKAITLKASKNNVESVFVDAFELEAGERIEIGSKAAMTITGAAGDKLTLMEI